MYHCRIPPSCQGEFYAIGNTVPDVCVSVFSPQRFLSIPNRQVLCDFDKNLPILSVFQNLSHCFSLRYMTHSGWVKIPVSSLDPEEAVNSLLIFCCFCFVYLHLRPIRSLKIINFHHVISYIYHTSYLIVVICKLIMCRLKIHVYISNLIFESLCFCSLSMVLCFSFY